MRVGRILAENNHTISKQTIKEKELWQFESESMGFGRIGRLVFRAICDRKMLGQEVEVVAVNDLVPADALAYMLKYDSTQGRFPGTVASEKSSPDLAEDDTIVVDGHKVRCLSVKEGPAALPWKELNVDLVIESTRPVHRRHEGPGTYRSGGRKKSSFRPRRKTRTLPSYSASTRKNSTSPSTMSSRTRVARPIAWRQSSTFC